MRFNHRRGCRSLEERREAMGSINQDPGTPPEPPQRCSVSRSWRNETHNQCRRAREAAAATQAKPANAGAVTDHPQFQDQLSEAQVSFLFGRFVVPGSFSEDPLALLERATERRRERCELGPATLRGRLWHGSAPVGQGVTFLPAPPSLHLANPKRRPFSARRPTNRPPSWLVRNVVRPVTRVLAPRACAG